MRKYLLAGIMVAIASTSQAQVPDPRDSVILESKILAPGLTSGPFGNPPAFTMKVYITNKDTIGILWLALRESTVTGTAYADLDSIGPRGKYDDGWNMGDCLTTLKNTLDAPEWEDFTQYDGNSPDRFFVAMEWTPVGVNPLRHSEPANATRSAIWELRFMSTDSAWGEIRFDNTSFIYPPYQVSTSFTILRQGGQYVADIPVNFLPGIISVQQAPKGDMNWDFVLRPADIVLHLNCIMLGTIPPAGTGYCDVNCDGAATIADVVLELKAVYRKEEFPC